MNICFIMDNSETMRHPVIASALQKLSETHSIRLLDVNGQSSTQALAQEQCHSMADLYLLKSHARQALDVACHLEQHGAWVVNSWEATNLCRDRAAFCQRLQKAGLPVPETHSVSDLVSLSEHLQLLDKHNTHQFPLMLKSRYSRRGDLVTKVESLAQLEALSTTWGNEPVILQHYVEGDGWDIKLWVIGQRVFAAQRRTALETGSKPSDVPVSAEDMPAEWVHIAQTIGRAFGLHLYGVDLLVSREGLFVVDVNSFPGFRGVPDADSALVALVEQLIAERLVCL